MWTKAGDLHCDTCSTIFLTSSDVVKDVVLNAARAKGWHLFAGRSLTEKLIDRHLCPACVGSNRNRTSGTPNQPLEGEIPLF